MTTIQRHDGLSGPGLARPVCGDRRRTRAAMGSCHARVDALHQHDAEFTWSGTGFILGSKLAGLALGFVEAAAGPAVTAHGGLLGCSVSVSSAALACSWRRRLYWAGSH